MVKINKEEYELLKSSVFYWKWIAREEDGRLYKFHGKPKKVKGSRWIDKKQTWLGMSSDSFQFIQWEDEEPYNVAELIEHYEYWQRLAKEPTVANLVGLNKESEETEVKKDIEWLKSRFAGRKIFSPLNDREIGYNKAIDEFSKYVDQLDEPETLSLDWISDNVEYAYYMTPKGTYSSAKAVIDPNKLENILVPKQELPVIPKFVAEWINEMKQDERPLYSVMSSLMNKTNHEWAVWKSANKNFSEIVAQAWLDGFTVEEEPKLTVRTVIEKHIELLKKQEEVVNLKPYYDLLERVKNE